MSTVGRERFVLRGPDGRFFAGRRCRKWEARLVCNRDQWDTPGETPRLIADLAAAFGRHAERAADLPVQPLPEETQP